MEHDRRDAGRSPSRLTDVVTLALDDRAATNTRKIHQHTFKHRRHARRAPLVFSELSSLTRNPLASSESKSCSPASPRSDPLRRRHGGSMPSLSRKAVLYPRHSERESDLVDELEKKGGRKEGRKRVSLRRRELGTLIIQRKRKMD